MLWVGGVDSLSSFRRLFRGWLLGLGCFSVSSSFLNGMGLVPFFSWKLLGCGLLIARLVCVACFLSQLFDLHVLISMVHLDASFDLEIAVVLEDGLENTGVFHGSLRHA